MDKTKRYKEEWNYKTQEYDKVEYTEDDYIFEQGLEEKICQFCNENKATGRTSSGGSKVYHCSRCVRDLGYDVINSRLSNGRNTKEMLKLVEFLKLTKED